MLEYEIREEKVYTDVEEPHTISLYGSEGEAGIKEEVITTSLHGSQGELALREEITITRVS